MFARTHAPENCSANINQARAQLDLQKSYSAKNFGINLQLFDLQTKWTNQDFDKNEARNEVQRGWQIEDFGQQRYGFELQAGWQEEDMQRNLRYATGRQRLDIRRQMERQSVMNNLKRTQMAIAEGRAETQYGWQTDDLNTQRERWNITRPLQREQMVGSYEYQMEMTKFQEQNIEFQERALELQKERAQNFKDDYAAETPLMLELQESATRYSTLM